MTLLAQAWLCSVRAFLPDFLRASLMTGGRTKHCMLKKDKTLYAQDTCWGLGDQGMSPSCGASVWGPLLCLLCLC